jgi:hypothetical protein
VTVRIYKAEVLEGESLWPAERPWDWLMRKKKVMPRPFYNAQYMNDPSGLRGVRYDVTWLQFYRDVNKPPNRELSGVQAGDPATSEDKTANLFGHATVAKHIETGIIYVLGFAFDQIEATKHLDFLEAQYLTWLDRGLQVQKVLLETGGPQQATTQHLIEQTRQSSSGAMPIMEFNPKGSKEEKFDSLLPYFANGTILFKGEQAGEDVVMSSDLGFQEFLREFSMFPKGGRDDLLDALYMAVTDLVGVGIAASGNSSDTSPEMTKDEKRAKRAEEYDKEVDNPQGETPRDRVLANSVRGRFLGSPGRFNL